MDRQEARRRRRRRGQMRLAVLVAVIIAVIVVAVLLIRGCGGQANDESGGAAPETTRSAAPTAAGTARPTASPKPISTLPPLVGLGETVRFQTPQGAVVRVTASDYADPGTAPDGVSADPGERLVTLKLTVTPEGAEGTAAVPLPFKKAASFLLVMEDDQLAAARLGDDVVLGATLPPGESVTTTLAFSVGASPPIRFVCMPVEGSTPRSATWQLK